MNPFRITCRALLGLTLLVFTVALTGCGGPEIAGKSDRPWNSPRSWEHGLPTGLNEGR